MHQIQFAKRIVFLGDSITHAGDYVAAFDAWLVSRGWDPVVIDVGLPSETVSGLSEEGHAGGQFPRPDLAERLARVLDATKPDLVIACYGINCGIYQDFDEGRFAKYQAGMTALKAAVEKRGAKFVVMTPPSYDDQRAKGKFSYNQVLDKYSDWLLSQRKNGWWVIDLHGPMTHALAERRKTQPDFTFQPDAVHPNAEGQWFMARTAIDFFGGNAWGGFNTAKDATAEKFFADRNLSPDVRKKITARMHVRRDAYLAAAGHKRPGMAKGLPVEEAEKKAAELTEEIDAAVKSK